MARSRNFEEIEFSKTDYNTKHTILWCFVLYHMTQQLSLAVHEGVSSWLAPADELKLLEFFRQAGPEAEGLFRELAAAAILIIPSPQRDMHVEELVSRHRAKLSNYFSTRMCSSSSPAASRFACPKTGRC